MKKIAIITNIPAPYRVDFFSFLQTKYDEYEFFIIYCSENEDNRKWDVKVNKNSHFLNSKTIKIKTKEDFKYIHLPINMYSTLNEIHPDLIIASEYSLAIMVSLIWSKTHKIPFISWTDGTIHSEKGINFVQKLNRKIVINSSTQFIASSTKSKEVQMAYGAPESKIHISYLSFDLKKYKQKKVTSNNRILFVGRLVKGKGLDILINTVSKIKSPEFHLDIVGTGPEEENLKRQVTDLKLNEKISFLGHKNTDELKKIYYNSDILVVPSRNDCFGLVILEGMCSSLAVIASNYADGSYDLIDEGKTGYIFDLYDEKYLLNKIIFLLNNPLRTHEMGELAYKRTEKFHFDNVSFEFNEAIRLCFN